MTYACPMHPAIRQPQPGRCPICGMKLVSETEDRGLGPVTWKNYLPLIVIVSLLLATTAALTYRDWLTGQIAATRAITYFMAGFFLAFSAFKLMDLPGFAEGYAMYDLLAQRWHGYGYIYPFIEVAFGLGMVLAPSARGLLVAEIIVMVFSGMGVALKLARKEPFQCACLGTFLKVPLTTITLGEDFGMAALAALALVLR